MPQACILPPLRRSGKIKKRDAEALALCACGCSPSINAPYKKGVMCGLRQMIVRVQTPSSIITANYQI